MDTLEKSSIEEVTLIETEEFQRQRVAESPLDKFLAEVNKVVTTDFI